MSSPHLQRTHILLYHSGMDEYPEVLRIQMERSRERATVMHSLLVQGKSLQEVSSLFSMSRERVRQLVSKHFPEYKPLRGRRRKQ